MARRAKPKHPSIAAAERRRKDFAAVNLPDDACKLQAFADVEITRAGQRREGRVVDKDQARRMDAFGALREGMEPGAYDAARRLELDIAIRCGEHDRGRPMERVDGESPTDRMDNMVAAAKRVDAVLSRVGPRDAWLLSELINPSVSVSLRCQTWREVVAYITGETHAHAQGAAVRAACANLRDAYDLVQRRAA
jgi:hypothetical protein